MPGTASGVSGGSSRPVKLVTTLASSCAVVDMAMKAPEKSVPRPEIPARPMRGRSTQKRVFSFRYLSVSLAILTETMTPVSASSSWIFSTLPTSTLRKRTGVFPAASPSADSKRMVMSSPREA